MSSHHHWIIITSSFSLLNWHAKHPNIHCTSVLDRLCISNSNQFNAQAVYAKGVVAEGGGKPPCRLGRIIRRLCVILKNNQPILRRWLTTSALALTALEQWPHNALDSSGNKIYFWLAALACVNHGMMRHCPRVPNTVYLQGNKALFGIWLLPKDCKIDWAVSPTH